jgi:short-subunit dehydrogenase
LRPCGIKVCLIEPGSVATPIWGKGRAMQNAMFARLSDAHPPYYRTAIEALGQVSESEDRNGMPVERVADAVVSAFTDRKPKARRIIGLPAKIGAALSVLPPSLHDRILRASMRIP